MKFILCACAFSKLLPENAIGSVYSKFYQEKNFLFLDDLCRVCATEKEKIANFCEGEVKVFACKKRAVKSLLEAANAKADFEFFNLKDYAEKILKNLCASEEIFDSNLLPKAEGNWIPWNPSIDYERCVACGKCVDFCMFKVYAKNGDKVEVVAPKNCKNECPACARICPKQAIIFPKCPDETISGGENFTEAKETDSNFYQALKLRRAFSKNIFKKNDS